MSAPQSAPLQTRITARNERINRRLHERVPIDCQVRLRWQDRQGNHVLRVRAMDLSHFGMLVETERAIEPGTVVAVETNYVTLGNACVRYCTPNGLKYKIGMHVPDHRRALLNSAKACAAGGGG